MLPATHIIGILYLNFLHALSKIGSGLYLYLEYFSTNKAASADTDRNHNNSASEKQTNIQIFHGASPIMSISAEDGGKAVKYTFRNIRFVHCINMYALDTV